MTGYADFTAPRLSDFLTTDIPAANDPFWPFTTGPGVKIRRGDYADDSSGAADIFPALHVGTPGTGTWNEPRGWAECLYDVRTIALNAGTAFNRGTIGDRKMSTYQGIIDGYLQDDFGIRRDRLGLWTPEVREYSTSTSQTLGLAGGLHYVDTGLQDRGVFYGDTHPMIAVSIDGWNAGSATLKPGWKAAVRSFLEDKIANDGWRFAKVHTNYPQVRPLSASTSIAAGGAFVVDVADGDPARIAMTDFAHLHFAKKPGTEKCVWMKVVQERDLRDPADPFFLDRMRHHTIKAGNSMGNRQRLYPAIRNKPEGYWTRFHVETLAGESPVTGAELRDMVGIDQGTSLTAGKLWNVPGLVNSMDEYVQWYGQYEDGAGTGYEDWVGRPVRLRVLLVPTTTDTGGLSSLADLLGRPDVMTALTVELFPEALVGPAADSPFEPIMFEAKPSVQTRLRLEMSWDGGKP